MIYNRPQSENDEIQMHLRNFYVKIITNILYRRAQDGSLAICGLRNNLQIIKIRLSQIVAKSSQNQFTASYHVISYYFLLF